MFKWTCLPWQYLTTERVCVVNADPSISQFQQLIEKRPPHCNVWEELHSCNHRVEKTESNFCGLITMFPPQAHLSHVTTGSLLPPSAKRGLQINSMDCSRGTTNIRVTVSHRKDDSSQPEMAHRIKGAY